MNGLSFCPFQVRIGFPIMQVTLWRRHFCIYAESPLPGSETKSRGNWLLVLNTGNKAP